MDIAQIRSEITDHLADTLGVPVFSAVPERLNPPLMYLREGEPFITPEEDGPFGSWVVNFSADLIVPVSAHNKVMIAAADMYVTELLGLISEYHITVDAYATANHAGQSYLSVPIHISYTNQ